MTGIILLSLFLQAAPESSGSSEITRYDNWLQIKQITTELKKLDSDLRENAEESFVKYPWAALTIGLVTGGYLHEIEAIGDHWFWPTVFSSLMAGFGVGMLRESAWRTWFLKLSALKSSRQIYYHWLPSRDPNTELVTEAANLMVQFSIWIENSKMNTSFERWHFLRTANAFILFVSKIETLNISDDKTRFLHEAVEQVFGAVKSILDHAHEQKDFPLARKAIVTRNRILGFMGSTERLKNFRKFQNLAGRAGISKEDLTEYSDEWDQELLTSISHFMYVSRVDEKLSRPTIRRISIRDETVIEISTPTEMLPTDSLKLKRFVLSGAIKEKLGPGLWARFPSLSEDQWTYFVPEDSIPKVEGMVDLSPTVEGVFLPSRRLQIFSNAFQRFSQIKATEKLKLPRLEPREKYPWLERCAPILSKLLRKI